MNPAQSYIFNLLRWVSAALVMVSHLRDFIFAPFGALTQKTPILKIFYFLTGFGHEAVMIFFVLSGYLVGGLSMRKAARAPFDPVDYGVKRFSRIYAVFLPALVFGLCLDGLGLHFFDAGGLYSRSETLGISSLPSNIQALLTPATFLGNLFMLQGIAVDHLGSNGPLWSLSYEWWYYVLFGAAMAATSTRLSRAARLACGAVLAAGLVLLPGIILAYGLVWVIGAAACWYGNSSLRKPPILVPLILLLLALGYSRVTRTSGHAYLNDLSIGVAFALLCASLATLRTERLPFERLQQFCADWSYSLYLTHFPLTVFVMALLTQSGLITLAAQPSVASFALFAGLCVLSVAVAMLFWLLFESRTVLVRRLILSLTMRLSLQR